MNSIEYAVKMENDGENYYREQARINEGNPMASVFLALADDEKNHGIMLENKLKGLSAVFQDNSMLLEYKNVFTGIKDYHSELDIGNIQLNVYMEAQQKEKESMDLYNRLLSEATDKKEKELFSFLVKQESEHYELFDKLIYFVNRPDAWPESAEFGLREEY